MSRNRKAYVSLKDEEKLLTDRELGEWLRWHPVTIRQKVRRREIPFLKLKGSLRFRVRDISRWLDEQAVDAVMR